MDTIKVMIVDDSAVVREAIRSVLESEPGIDVIGVAMDPLFALEKMKVQWPDVIVLDIEMPRMDGLTFLHKIMSEHPTPVVVCSTLVAARSRVAIEALAAGASSVISKPTLGVKRYLHEDAADDLVTAVKAAARSQMRRFGLGIPGEPARPAAKGKPVRNPAMHSVQLVAIGASTGGTLALERVLTVLPEKCVGIVIVQHMPEQFTAAFAQRLDTLCRIEVREARSGDCVSPGCALIAPGGRHMQVRRDGLKFRVEVIEGPLVNRHRPSVDVLFRSMAKQAGKHALGVIMTGMGDDGARGLKEMRDAGAYTLGESETSCVVYGMPREAMKIGAVCEELQLDAIAERISTLPGGAL